MTATALAELIWAEADLQTAVKQIAIRTATIDISAIDAPTTEAIDFNWFHLLRCASVFVATDSEFYFDKGLQILHGCLLSEASGEEKALAAALLTKIASNPSVRLAERRKLVPADVIDQLPSGLALEVRAHQIASTINIETNEFVGNDFQVELWKALNTCDWVSASAPTSAGKSYVLEKWIEHIVSTRDSSCTFFIVPTRALISQVETDLRQMLAARGDTVNVTSLPLSFSKDEAAHDIYVYTQERFHLYLLKNTQLRDADLIIIDEAQKIGADNRGILLQQVLELASSRYPDAKFLFASPSTENPETLLSFAPAAAKLGTVSGSRPTVGQNLYWVEQIKGQPKEWDVSLMVEAQASKLGRLHLEDRPQIGQKLAFIAQAVGGSSTGNVVYVNRAADAEKTAALLCQFYPDAPPDPELNALSELCEKAVHPQFMLRQFVKKGIAFHYGNIPQLIRTEVERLFSSGKIRFLVCTSTLVEGVNLSCRNIFMRNPKRGKSSLMSPDDFWNLAGRAGRWGKEFQGNIFCIDPQNANEWFGGSAPRSKKKHVIQIATQRAADQFDDFLNYITSGPASLKSSDRFFEQLFSYLVFRFSLFENLGNALSTSGLSADQLKDLQGAVEDSIDALKVPIEIVQRNPGINPFGMNALFEYFSSLDPSAYSDLVPADPLSDAPVLPENEEDEAQYVNDAAVDNFIGIFTRITKYLRGPLGEDQTAYGNALLVVHWMRGYPLARIIGRQIRYWTQRGKTAPAVIRETMERVEKVARFETPKYLHCYIDILLYFFKQVGFTEMSDRVEDFWMYLEFGVSKKTQLSLMALGMSRSSVTALSEFIKEDDLTEQGSLDWLEKTSWPEYGLARLVEIEIRTVLQRHGRTAPPEVSVSQV
jgi:hypothetical protein